MKLTPLQLETLRLLGESPEGMGTIRQGWMHSGEGISPRPAAVLVRKGLAESRRRRFPSEKPYGPPSSETYPEFRITKEGRRVLRELDKEGES